MYLRLEDITPLFVSILTTIGIVDFVSILITTMAQMAHFSFIYYFTILNSEFRIPNFEICTTNFGIRNCEVYVMWASGNRLSTLEGILNLQTQIKGSMP